MKQITLLLLLSALSGSIYAQKADTEKKKLKVIIPKSEFFQKLKTYDIIIQGDDTWNTEYADKKKHTYEKNLVKNTIEDYSKKDTINPDVRVLMGYKGATYKKSSNGQFVLDGDFKYLVLDKNNQILLEKGTNAIMYSPTYNGKPYTSLVNDLNNIGYKYLTDNNIITSEKELVINYGFFDKAEDFPELIEFNTKTDEFLKKIEANSLTADYLSGLEKFFLTYENKEYKKIKTKDYNKVIYLNLSLTQLFLTKLDKASEYLETAKQGTGMFSIWPIDTKANIDGLVVVNAKAEGAKVQNLSFDSAYYIYINGSATQNGKTQSGKLKVDRFANLAEGNILKSDDPTKPKVWINNANGEVDFILVDDKTTIKTADGLELSYISYLNNLILVEKAGENCYKKYESNSNLIYCNQGGKIEIKK
ncbi:hypothetical protein [Flavobacterium sp.]|uniref:hypothetical protein n=1 Tax=Flavobacterium sp. TaxID=239 RepID=UPI0026125946|nr:hypothetical protein [Flavobacterium sp.]MDG2433209.1 hypothetical protein [Flavobacterium sp.]